MTLMKTLRLTVAQKIAAGYLLVILFCVSATVYALVALGVQNRRSEELVKVDFEAVSVARDMRNSLLAQERLERQLLILRDRDLGELLQRRQEEFAELWERFQAIPTEIGSAFLGDLVTELRSAAAQSRAFFAQERWEDAHQLSRDVLSPVRDRLVGLVDQFLGRQDQQLHGTLNALSEESDRAYRVTLALVLVGIGLAGVVASRLIFKLHQDFGSLTRATREVAKGSFDYSVNLEADDEFGQLARDFAEMAEQLKELELERLDANPLTRLPGNLAIERELQARLDAGSHFAHVYVDLDHFKAYNDRYGYQAGSEIITAVAGLVNDAARDLGNPDDLVGHIGGDDYVIITTPDRAVPIAEQVMREFDTMIPRFYSDEDRETGYFMSEDRFGVERRFPLLTVSVAVVTSQSLKHATPEAIGRECAKIKEHLKRMTGSNYLVDRRENR